MRTALIALPLLVLLGRTAVAAETREVADKNFRLALPSDQWSFVECESSMKENGYVLGAQLPEDGGVLAHVRVTKANGLTTQEAGEEVRTGMASGLAKVGTSNLGSGRLSGLSGSLVALQGEAAGGAGFWFRCWTIKQGENLYQLLVTAHGGAETKRGGDIESLRRGFRLIEGAGPDEPASDPTFKAGEEPGAALGPDSEDFPAGGPKREGRTAVFPSHNLRWTLPEGSPFRWTGVTSEEPKKKQTLIAASASQPRSPVGEGEPATSEARVTLVVSPLPPGGSAENVVNHPANQQGIAQGIFGGNIDASKTKIDTSRTIGNFTGASLQMAGAEGKTVTYFILLAVCLHQTLYEFQVKLVGSRDVREVWGAPLGKLIEGIEFPNTTEAVAGPLLVNGVAPFGAARGTSADKETDVTIPGAEAKKPKGVASIPWEGDPNLRMAWEARSPDGQSYLYFDVRGWPLTQVQQANKKLESFVTEREGEWRSGGGSDAVTVTKGKDPFFDGAFGAAKGTAYRFTGSHKEHPFVELGWVVKSKANVLWIRTQFGGANAEKVMDPIFKAIKKGLKIS